VTIATPSPCRSCGADSLDLILSLGRTPLANALLSEQQLAEPEATFPLDLVFCPACSLVQITETVPPEVLFSHYVYLSSFSDTVLRSAEQLAGRLVKRFRLGPESLVAEVASNDGYLLQYYRQLGVPVLGIEPAQNIAELAAGRGIPTIARFFGSELAAELSSEGRRADVIHANNVLAHVADLNGVVAGLGTLLKPDGVAVVEVPHVLELVRNLEFDTIYHEHLCYFSLRSLTPLFERHGLHVVDVERIPLHGGSLRVFVAARGDASPAVAELAALEKEARVDRIEFYGDFAERVETLKGELLDLLCRLRSEGSRIAAYGASAKGSTLLNYFGVEPGTLEFVVDRSTVKQGLFTPGTHLPILPPEALLEKRPDYVLLLSWNFAEEILAQQLAYRAQGGRFVIPIPTVRID
jgi:SAM-dependent methyltransferase